MNNISFIIKLFNQSNIHLFLIKSFTLNLQLITHNQSLNHTLNQSCSLLTYNSQFGIRSYGRVQSCWSHLALILGIIVDGGIRDAQIVDTLVTIAQHRIARETRYHCLEAQGKTILGPLHSAGYVGHLAAHHRLGALKHLQIMGRGAKFLLLGMAGGQQRHRRRQQQQRQQNCKENEQEDRYENS